MEVLKGEHCAVSTCKQFDFLPFKCDSCGKTYCLDHRAQNAHDCISSSRPELTNVIPQCPICNSWIVISSGEDPNAKMDLHIRSNCTQYKLEDGSKNKNGSSDVIANSKGACAYSKCKAKRAPIECHDCHKFFCPEHRFPQDHMCGKSDSSSSLKSESKGLQMLAAMGITRPNTQKTTLPRGSALGQTNSSDSSSKSSLRSDSENNGNNEEKKQEKAKPKKQLSKETEAEIFRSRVRMRDLATGNTEIDSERRFYCCVQFSPTINKKEIHKFFDKNKTVGRILDEICDEKMIKNKNHLPDSDKLVLVCARTGGALPYDTPLRLLEPECMSGDTLLLRYESEQ